MGKHYHHISIEDRCEMARLQREGLSLCQIAASLDRSPSTVSRELKRNTSNTKGYDPGYAHQQARARRWRGSRLDRNPALRESVLSGLCAGWSPEQIAGRLTLEAGRTLISHETIYRFVHAQGNRTKDHAWFRLLALGKTKRGRRSRRGPPFPIFTCASPSPNVPQRLMTAPFQATGRPI